MFMYRVCVAGSDRNHSGWEALNDEILVDKLIKKYGWEVVANNNLVLHVYAKSHAYDVMNGCTPDHLICSHDFSSYSQEENYFLDVRNGSTSVPFYYMVQINCS